MRLALLGSGLSFITSFPFSVFTDVFWLCDNNKNHYYKRTQKFIFNNLLRSNVWLFFRACIIHECFLYFHIEYDVRTAWPCWWLNAIRIRNHLLCLAPVWFFVTLGYLYLPHRSLVMFIFCWNVWATMVTGFKKLEKHNWQLLGKHLLASEEQFITGDQGHMRLNIYIKAHI